MFASNYLINCQYFHLRGLLERFYSSMPRWIYDGICESSTWGTLKESITDSTHNWFFESASCRPTYSYLKVSLDRAHQEL